MQRRPASLPNPTPLRAERRLAFLLHPHVAALAHGIVKTSSGDPARFVTWARGLRSLYNQRMPKRTLHPPIHGTTVLCVRRDGKVVMAGDGQVTMGANVMKHTARKTRRLFNDKVLAGFAGSTADALSLFERFEGKLQEHHGNLAKSSVELAKEWRKDRALRHLEALLLVADAKGTFVLSGDGDVIEPDDGMCAIGSGGPFALAAARALAKHSKLGAKDIAQEAMRIASEICIYTNANFTIEEL